MKNSFNIYNKKNVAKKQEYSNHNESKQIENVFDKVTNNKKSKTLEYLDDKLKEDNRYDFVRSITKKFIPENTSLETRETYEVLGTFLMFNLMDKYLDI